GRKNRQNCDRCWAAPSAASPAQPCPAQPSPAQPSPPAHPPGLGAQLPLSPAHSSPLASPGSSENTWLMVRFCRAVKSEIMSLDLRRSSMCTDCHSPTGREHGIASRWPRFSARCPW
uniref:Uncharacterized protein n=1 Tax=Cyanistes caeruleus TaxID=156563 RepID=A0A8C0ZH19_CYACU